ncbi:MAG: HAMP domain-containing histidine kinase [Lachnospiraceae bacterium]|nr:HAMP domain-containing histidine kinase [Lachnospiraceae bacterium]
MGIRLWQWIAVVLVLCLVILLLCIKIALMRKSAQEIAAAFAERLTTESNTLIDISSHDRSMRRLAADVNAQLRMLRMERLRCQQGSRELMDSVTNISHDLRTPLTAVCGYLDLLRQTSLPADAARYLDIIEERVDTLRQLTQELFGYSAAVSTIQEESYTPVVLNSALEEVLSAYYAALKKRQIAPVVTLPEERVVRRLNKSALFRIFGNILSNVLKYSDGDLTVTLSEQGEIVFANHAAALNELQVMQLFNRYYTVETAANATGIGLSIARELTEQMRGTIGARYENGVLCICVRF